MKILGGKLKTLHVRESPFTVAAFRYGNEQHGTEYPLNQNVCDTSVRAEITE